MDVDSVSQTTPLLLYIVLSAPVNYHCFMVFGNSVYWASFFGILLFKGTVFFVAFALCMRKESENNEIKKQLQYNYI